MPQKEWSLPTRRALPLILIRGFGGLGVDDERRVAYQGFNEGTVYPHKRGENYIYEGLILRFMKSSWQYQDATNVVGYFASPVTDKVDLAEPLADLNPNYFFAQGDRPPAPEYKVVLDPEMALTIRDHAKTRDSLRTLWVFRYYDLNDRTFALYGSVLMRVIDFVRDLTVQTASETTDHHQPKVNIIAHSMGGLIVREAIQRTYPASGRSADECINKIVTLGTPHQGISFQILRNWIGIDAEKELEHFNSSFQLDPKNETAVIHLHEHFDLKRLLTVVGTNYRTYGVTIASWANRLFSVGDEYGPTYNRSDGLVKQAYAQVAGAPRSFVHKCHGGQDSLVTSREAFEIATRFFFGNLRARLRMTRGEITRGKDFFGRSEFFFGVSIKPRRVDFDLFHQSAEAENCYGPFQKAAANGTIDFSEGVDDLAFPWADHDRLIWEGYLDTSQVIPDPSTGIRDMVFRLDFYVGERDRFGIGFSDNVVFRKQYYVRTLIDEHPVRVFVLPGEDFGPPDAPKGAEASAGDAGWEFQVGGTGFNGTFRIELDAIPLDGNPVPILPVGKARLPGAADA